MHVLMSTATKLGVSSVKNGTEMILYSYSCILLKVYTFETGVPQAQAFLRVSGVHRRHPAVRWRKLTVGRMGI